MNRTTVRKSRRHNWLSVVSFVVLIVVSLIGLAIWQMDSVQFMSVESNSMAPVIRKGDAVVVKPVADPKSLVAGDVISYRSPANQSVIITHRIIRTEPQWHLLVTQGDNTKRADKPVSMDNVVGKVNVRIAYAGYLLDFIRTPIGLAVAVYLPAALIIGSELLRLARYYRRPTYRLPGYRHSH